MMMNIIPMIKNSALFIIESQTKDEQDLKEITYYVTPKEASEEGLFIKFSFPYVDCAGVLHPNCGTNRSNLADWDAPYTTMTASSAPILSIFSEDSYNTCTIALSETKEVVHIGAGIHEEDGEYVVSIEIPTECFTTNAPYVFKLMIDTRHIPFSHAIQAVTHWWERDCAIIPMDVTPDAKEPVYSTWYNFHQQVDGDAIEKECELASALGFQTIIMDDGWQTDDNNRGYAYCGDWEVCEGKMPDFKSHVKRIQDMGMKYMLWYSVPFLGKHAQAWDRFKDKILTYNESLQAGVFDPRYPDVREYLIGVYKDMVMATGIDGLKLDFIDQMMTRATTPVANEAMDFTSVQDGLDALMTGVSLALLEINPAFLIEFRQRYIGPNMRKYGNIFRVTDCPNSAIRNRVGSVDLRLMSGNTAVHSDMLMWHSTEKPEVASIQIISSIFSTIQISLMLRKVSPAQNKSLAFWLSFMKENKEILLNNPILAKEPHNLYPEVRSQKEDKEVIAIYTCDRVVAMTNSVHQSIILNGTKSTRQYIAVDKKTTLEIVQVDCYGDEVYRKTVVLETGAHKIDVTIGGIIYLNVVE